VSEVDDTAPVEDLWLGLPLQRDLPARERLAGRHVDASGDETDVGMLVHHGGERGRPPGVDDDVVVGEEDDLVPGVAPAEVAGPVDPGPVGAQHDVGEPVPCLGDLRAHRRRRVDDHQLVAVAQRRTHAGQAPGELLGTVARGHDH
jgi:hypothetical protein